MPSAAQQRYAELQRDIQNATNEERKLRSEIDDLENQLAASELDVAGNPLKQRAVQLNVQIQKLVDKKFEMKVILLFQFEGTSRRLMQAKIAKEVAYRPRQNK